MNLFPAVAFLVVSVQAVDSSEQPIVLGSKEPYTTSPPVSYLAYSLDPEDNSALFDSFKHDVPEVLHVSPPLVGLTGAIGPIRKYFDAKHIGYDRLSQDEALEKEEKIREINKRLHQAGVKAIIPYLCNQTIGGDPDKRLGLWDFYDHWDEYPKLNLGPKPPVDPIEWMQRHPDGGLHFTYPKDMPVFKPGYRFQPSQNNPHWRRFLRVVTRRIAECGYDGLFVDNCILHSYDDFSQERFQKYLASRYPKEDWPKLFGITDGRARLYDPQRGNSKIPYNYAADSGRPIAPDFTPQEALLWVETQRFWADSIVEQMGEMKAEGTAVRNRPFLIVANWGPMYRTSAVDSRRQDAKDVALFNRISDGIMYEDELDMGRLADGLYNDNILQYRYSLALGASTVELPYVRSIESFIELGLAECWAGGGGAFCWYSLEFADIRGRYAQFARSHPKLYEGLTSFSRVGLCFFFDQLYFENIEHLRQVYALSHYLTDQGVLFDFVPESACQLETLRRWKAVIVPHITHISDEQKNALTEYVREGGTLVIVGHCAERTETAVSRTETSEEDPFRIVSENLKTIACGSVEYNQGNILYGRTLSDLLPVYRCSLDTLKNFYFTTGDLVGDNRKSNGQELMARAGSQFKIDRYVSDGGPLERMLAKAVPDPLGVFPGDPIPGLRASAYLSDDGKRLVVHLVNYNVPINGEDHRPEPVRDVVLRIPLPDGKKTSGAYCFEPGISCVTSLFFPTRKGTVNIRVPQVRIYRVIEVLLE